MATATTIQTMATEQHYSIHEIAELWGLSANTIRRIFDGVPGVLRISYPRIFGRDAKRAPRTVLRIPASLLEAAHEQRSCGLRPEIKRGRR